ncbi:hypothetical protein EDD15DRAFT_1161865 [Pisolithus albus]|nr:hypothetical protein EDD15DRAFT_1161865 [Pisolithus albus]
MKGSTRHFETTHSSTWMNFPRQTLHYSVCIACQCTTIQLDWSVLYFRFIRVVGIHLNLFLPFYCNSKTKLVLTVTRGVTHSTKAPTDGQLGPACLSAVIDMRFLSLLHPLAPRGPPTKRSVASVRLSEDDGPAATEFLADADDETPVTPVWTDFGHFSNNRDQFLSTEDSGSHSNPSAPT